MFVGLTPEKLKYFVQMCFESVPAGFKVLQRHEITNTGIRSEPKLNLLQRDY